MDVGNLIGLILTAIGTLITIWQATKAKSYRDEIVEDRKKLSLIDLKSSLIQIRSECRKISTPVNKPLRGVNPQKIIDELQDFVVKMKENEHKINLQEFSESITTMEKYISDYKNENDEEIRSNIGDMLFQELSDLGGLIAKDIDDKV